MTLESPHIGLQVEGVPTAPLHYQPVTGPEQSEAHLESPFVSPSSQASFACRILSPQEADGEQLEGEDELPVSHEYPIIAPSQVLLQ